MALINALFNILHRVQQTSGTAFTGIGLIVSDKPEELPIFPIRGNPTPPIGQDITTFLSSISVESNEYHDGFHVLSPEFLITRLSQYFSPPIVPNITIDRSKPFGGRYLAALFGSTLRSVLLTGVASNRTGLSVFDDGVERRIEK